MTITKPAGRWTNSWEIGADWRLTGANQREELASTNLYKYMRMQRQRKREKLPTPEALASYYSSVAPQAAPQRVVVE